MHQAEKRSKPPFYSGFRCNPDQFTCTNGECVTRNLLCDDDHACKDGSDEENCACPFHKFACQGGGCLLVTALCNGRKDCPGGDDENNCRMLAVRNMLA